MEVPLNLLIFRQYASKQAEEGKTMEVLSLPETSNPEIEAGNLTPVPAALEPEVSPVTIDVDEQEDPTIDLDRSRNKRQRFEEGSTSRVPDVPVLSSVGKYPMLDLPVITDLDVVFGEEESSKVLSFIDHFEKATGEARNLMALVTELRSKISDKIASEKELRRQMTELSGKLVAAQQELETGTSLKEAAETNLQKMKQLKEKHEASEIKLASEVSKLGTQLSDATGKLYAAENKITNLEAYQKKLEASVGDAAISSFENAMLQVRLIAPDIDFSRVSVVNQVRDGEIVPLTIPGDVVL